MNAEMTHPVLPLPPYTSIDSDVMWCHMILYTDKHTLQCTTATWVLSESSHDFIDLQILEWWACSDNGVVTTTQLTLTISPVKVLSDPANQNPVPIEAIWNKTVPQDTGIIQDEFCWQNLILGHLFNTHPTIKTFTIGHKIPVLKKHSEVSIYSIAYSNATMIMDQNFLANLQTIVDVTIAGPLTFIPLQQMFNNVFTLFL